MLQTGSLGFFDAVCVCTFRCISSCVHVGLLAYSCTSFRGGKDNSAMENGFAISSSSVSETGKSTPSQGHSDTQDLYQHRCQIPVSRLQRKKKINIIVKDENVMTNTSILSPSFVHIGSQLFLVFPLTNKESQQNKIHDRKYNLLVVGNECPYYSEPALIWFTMVTCMSIRSRYSLVPVAERPCLYS